MTLRTSRRFTSLFTFQHSPTSYTNREPPKQAPRILLHEKMDATLARKAQGPTHFVTTFANESWLFDERYLGHIVVGLNARMGMLQQMPEWADIGPIGQNTHTFVAFLKEAETDLPLGGTIDWIECPEVPEQVLEAVQRGMLAIDTAWKPPPPTEVMEFIRKIEIMARDVFRIADRLRYTEEVTSAELRDIFNR